MTSVRRVTLRCVLFLTILASGISGSDIQVEEEFNVERGDQSLRHGPEGRPVCRLEDRQAFLSLPTSEDPDGHQRVQILSMSAQTCANVQLQRAQSGGEQKCLPANQQVQVIAVIIPPGYMLPENCLNALTPIPIPTDNDRCWTFDHTTMSCRHYESCEAFHATNKYSSEDICRNNNGLAGNPEIEAKYTVSRVREDKKIPLPEFEGRPTIDSVNVLKDGRDVTSGGRYRVEDNSKLVIPSARETDSGVFTIVGTEPDGTRHTVTMKVIFSAQMENLVKKEIPRPQSSTAPAVPLRDIVMHCDVRDDDRDTQVTWYKDGRRIYESSKYKFEGKSKLKIAQASPRDSGHYQCEARSTYTSVKTVTDLTVEQSDQMQSDIAPTPAGVIEIPCVVNNAEPIIGVTWYKNGRPVPRNRKYQNIENNKLRILDACPDDSGIYECEVTTRSGSLSAITPISVVNTASSKALLLEPQGDDFTVEIVCSTNLSPVSSVLWSRAGRPITTGGRYHVTDSHRLRISQATTADEGVYLCEARDHYGGESSTPVTVKIIGGRPGEYRESALEWETSSTRITKDLNIPCRISLQPLRNVEWFKDGTPLLPYGRLSVNPRTFEILIRDVKATDEGTYECRASKGNTQYISKTTLQVTKKNLHTLAAEMGPDGSLDIPCAVNISPIEHAVWFKDGRPVNPAVHKITQFHSLRIEAASVRDTGTYECRARNDHAEHSISIFVTVKPATPRSQNLMQSHERDVTIPCQVDLYPINKVTWYKDGQRLLPGGHLAILGDHSVRITGVSSRDSGTYVCEARNHESVVSISHYLEWKTSSSGSCDTCVGASIDEQDRASAQLKWGSMYYYEGGKLLLLCQQGGAETHVTWFKDDQALTSSHRVRVVDDNFLVIEYLQRGDTGNYKCEVRNDLSYATSYMDIEVHGPESSYLKKSSELLHRLMMDQCRGCSATERSRAEQTLATYSTQAPEFIRDMREVYAKYRQYRGI